MIVIFVLNVLLRCTMLVYAVKEKVTGKTDIITKEEKHIYTANVAVDVDRYTDLIMNSRLFFDTSSLIEAFLKHSASVVLMSCPKGWGKTMNLHMMMRFFEMNVDEEGVHLLNKFGQYRNVRIFKYGEVSIKNKMVEKFTKPLLITRRKRILHEYLGQYPVIFVQFRMYKFPTYDGFEYSIRKMLSGVYRYHKYMVKVLENLKFDPYVTEEVRRHAKANLYRFEKVLYESELDPTALEDSLYFLSEILHSHFQKPVFIFIDDYDALIQAAFLNRALSEVEEVKMLKFFDNFFRRTFEKNEHLKKAFITGMFPIVDKNMSKVIEQHLFLDSPFAQYYGIQEEDMQMAFDFGKITPQVVEAAHNWLDGFVLSGNSNRRVYCPESVAKFLNSKMIKCHWNDSAIDVFGTMIENFDFIRNETMFLLSGMTISPDLLKDEWNFYNIFECKKKIYRYNETDYDESTIISLFYSYLTVSGYLSRNERNGDSFGLANKEITWLMASRMLYYYQLKYNVVTKIHNIATQMKDFILDENLVCENLTKALDQYYRELPVFRDCEKWFRKKPYHSNAFWDSPHLILNIILLQLRLDDKFQTMVQYSETLETVMVYDNGAKRGAVVGITFNEADPQPAIILAKRQRSNFGRFNNESIKYIGFDVTNIKVQIRAELKE